VSLGVTRKEMNIQNKKAKALRELQSLINIGPATAQRLYSIGVTTSEQLKRSNPEEIYERLKLAEGGVLDKCVLYQIQGSILNIPWWECKNLSKVSNMNRKLENKNARPSFLTSI